VTSCCVIETPIGPLTIVGSPDAVTSILFSSTGPSGTGFSRCRKSHTGAPAEAARQLREYFAGARTAFDLPLQPRGTQFQRNVWNRLREIPYGETISYGELARRIGNPKASRAVGAANGANPLPIVVPCHRVIGSTGALTGFGGGLSVKRFLLALESGITVQKNLFLPGFQPLA
jgi:methylated-DNA-[protein]-cysteine S-methyltransferase